MKLLKWLILLLGSLVLISCSEKKDNSSEVTFTSLYTNLFSQNCASCHVEGQQAYDIDGVTLDFSTQTKAYNSLINNTVTGASSIGTCNGVEIVASTASNSYLIGVLYADYAISNFAGTASCTPINTHHIDGNISSLADTYKSNLVSWINSGAPNN